MTKIFLLDDLFNKHGQRDWSTAYPAEDEENDEYLEIDWSDQEGIIGLEGPIPVSVVGEPPTPDFSLQDGQLVVFNYGSARIEELFGKSQVEWLPCKVVATYDADTDEEVPALPEHQSLDIAIANPLIRCRLAPDAVISRVGNGFWNQVESIENLSLFEDDLTRSEIFMIEGSPLTFCSVAFKKKAQELGITGIKFDRLSTLTC